MGETEPRDRTAAVRSRERRHIAVLFCDVVGSSELATRLDEEEFADLIGTYRSRCGAIVSAHEGLVAQYLGDGIVAYFGYPAAHEDGAERAIRSALEIVATDGPPLPMFAVRIGIATGSVVIEDRRERSRSSQAADDVEDQPDVWGFGEPLNLAAHLQTLAKPGTIVVSDQTRRLCGGVFEYEDFGLQVLKGQPVRAWRVFRESKAPSRFHALRAADLTPLVNRREELGEIAGLWESAKHGRGVTLLVSGEAGVGKSRLADEVVNRLAGSGAQHVRYACSPHLTRSPLAPLVRLLPGAAHFAEEDDNRTKLQKLERFVAALEIDSREAVPLLATLLSIPCEESYPPLGLSPQRQRQRLFEVLLDLVKSAASHAPLLIVVEDLHWIDPSSSEVLGMVIEATARLPILTIVTTRPEQLHQWQARAHLIEMRLRTLDRDDSLTMIGLLCRGHVMPQEAITAIADRTDGLPLFIEDLTKDILETTERQTRHDGTTGPGRRVNIPVTLKATLTSRLERLGPAKRLAQISAVIGREFSYQLLSQVTTQATEELNEHIGRMVESGLVTEQPSSAGASYQFKHALICEYAYETILTKERVALHTRISDVLARSFPETVDHQPEVLAYHLQAAGEIDRAITLWIAAAKLSARRSGFKEAIDQLGIALTLSTAEPSSPARRRLELRIHLTRGGIYAEQKGFSSEECGTAYNRALELCRDLNDGSHIFAALSAVGSYEITRGNLPSSRALAEECLQLARQQPSRPPFVMGHLLLGGTLFLSGQFATSRSHLDEAIRLYEEDRSSQKGKQVLFVQDQKSTGLCYLGLGLTIMGHFDAGLAAAQEGVRHARALGAVHALNFSLCYLAGVHNFRREATEALQYATESLELAREQGFATWRGASQIVRGEALMALGSIEEGFAEIEAGVNAHRNIEAISYHTFTIGARVRGLLKTGRLEQALAAVDEGVAISNHRGERFYLAELIRLKGETLARLGRAPEAEQWLNEAIVLAANQEARLFQLRSTVSLCRHFPDGRGAAEARRVLAQVCEWFAARVTTPDLVEARQMLSATNEGGHPPVSDDSRCTT